MNTLPVPAVKVLVTVINSLKNGQFMKTSLSRFFLLGVALALNSGCSPQSSKAQTQPTPVVSAPLAPMVAPETPISATAPTTAPAIVPPNILPTSPLAQVVRLTQAGVDQSIIMVYVTNSSRTFNLDSDKIIYLSDLGLPTELVTAMMQRDQFLQQQFAAAQAEQQAQQLQPTQATPPPETAPANVAEVVTQPAPVTVNYFNETLSPYGSWVVVAGYGRCWRPTAVTYDVNWQPYCDRGHWVYTDCGWYWSSDYAWGATFHYGRWFRDTSVGWCWYPDTVWSPSWVTWRYSDNYCGWAPLPPRTYCQTGVGIVYQGGGVSVGLSFGLGASCFTFVPTQYFCNSHPRNYCATPAQGTQIYNNTTVINNIRIHGSGNNQIIINNGIPVQSVANTTQTPIRPVPVHQIDAAFGHGGGSRPVTDRPNHVLGGNRANFTGNTTLFSQPVAAPHPETAAPATTQNQPRSTVIAGNGNGRSARSETRAQTHLAQVENTQTPQVGLDPVNQTSIRPPVGRNNPTTRDSQRSVAAANYRAPAYAAPVQNPAANFKVNPAPAPARWPQPEQSGIPRNYTRNPEGRQNNVAQSQVVAPPVSYSAPAQPQPQPRTEMRQNYSPSPVVAAPQHNAPNFASSPSQQPLQNNARIGNQSWMNH